MVFGDDVCVIGDGFENEIVVAGEKLYKYDVCFEEGKNVVKSHLKNNVSDSY